MGDQAAGQVCSLRLPSTPHITPPPPLGGQVSQADTRNSGYQESLFMLLSQVCQRARLSLPSHIALLQGRLGGLDEVRSVRGPPPVGFVGFVLLLVVQLLVKDENRSFRSAG